MKVEGDCTGEETLLRHKRIHTPKTTATPMIWKRETKSTEITELEIVPRLIPIREFPYSKKREKYVSSTNCENNLYGCFTYITYINRFFHYFT